MQEHAHHSAKMNTRRRVQSPSASHLTRSLQLSKEPSFQQFYVVPVGSTTVPVEPVAVDLSSNAPPLKGTSVPSIAPKPDPSVVSSLEILKEKQQPSLLDDREMRRRVS